MSQWKPGFDGLAKRLFDTPMTKDIMGSY
ncbi:uncharacterized protein METZ01_LOCUS35751 [marine metagenome]|uniref:Uncharacterized protein n=1 Tax=marine metagenome TaxID=408172 RepID=A0A381QZ12_9ZZZZ